MGEAFSFSFLKFLSASSSKARPSTDHVFFFTPHPLRAVRVLSSPMVSGWVGGWLVGQLEWLGGGGGRSAMLW